MPSGLPDKMQRGPKRLDDVDFTFTNTRVEARDKTNGGLTTAYIISDLEMGDGHLEEQAWEIVPVEWLNDRETGEAKAFISDEGALLDVDEENPFQVRSSSDAGMLTTSLLNSGLSATIVDRIYGEPSLLNGVKVHGVQEPNGQSWIAKKGASKGQKIIGTTLVVDRIIEDPHTDNKKSAKKPTGAGTGAGAAAQATGGKKPAPKAAEPVEEEAEESASELFDLDQAGVNVVTEVLGDPKKHVKTYSSRQNGGGVTAAQMASAVMIVYKGKNPPKSDLVAVVKDPDWAESMAEAGGWTFDRAKGIYLAQATD